MWGGWPASVCAAGRRFEFSGTYICPMTGPDVHENQHLSEVLILNEKIASISDAPIVAMFSETLFAKERTPRPSRHDQPNPTNARSIESR